MRRLSRNWRIVAAIFVFVNVAGAIYAFALGQQMHGETHLALLLFGFIGYLVMRGPPESRRDFSPPELADQRIDHLQQSVDAIALEVERMSEAQRFNDKLKAERKDNPGSES